jgi:hypothetical protein
MNPTVEYIGFSSGGILSKETWRATNLACPRCGNKGGMVWALTSEQPIIVMGTESRIFLCISCQFTGVGLNGFKADFATDRRAQEIIKTAFGDSNSE